MVQNETPVAQMPSILRLLPDLTCLSAFAHPLLIFAMIFTHHAHVTGSFFLKARAIVTSSEKPTLPPPGRKTHCLRARSVPRPHSLSFAYCLCCFCAKSAEPNGCNKDYLAQSQIFPLWPFLRKICWSLLGSLKARGPLRCCLSLPYAPISEHLDIRCGPFLIHFCVSSTCTRLNPR